MTVESKIEFFVRCDGDGCRATCPTQGPGYSSASAAWEIAKSRGWTKNVALHLCPEHDEENNPTG